MDAGPRVRNLSRPTFSRRTLLCGGLASAATWSLTSRAFAGSSKGAERHDPNGAASELRVVDVELEGNRRIARKARLLIPRGASKKRRLPAVILLHGLGETRSTALGLKAWSDFYGLHDAYRQLRHPPLDRPDKGARYMTDAHREVLDRSLRAKPFRGLICVCPVTPNPHDHPSASGALDEYASWLEETLMPAVQQRAPVSGRWGLDGCSLGGYVALETFARKPTLFSTLGSVQAAIGTARVDYYAGRVKAAVEASRAVPIHLETSSNDPYRKANEALAKALASDGIPAKVAVFPGPHSQSWLREVGTLAMLRWHERHLY